MIFSYILFMRYEIKNLKYIYGFVVTRYGNPRSLHFQLLRVRFR